MPAIPQLLRAAALKLPDAQESIACKGTAAECVTVQAKKKNFLFLKKENEIMLKLRESIPEAEQCAAKYPGNYKVGAGGWMIIKFGPESPADLDMLKRWVAESYAAVLPPPTAKKTAKRPAKK